MEIIKDKEFSGERPLFASHDLTIDNVTVHEGESALKECSNIIVKNSRFEGKYPFWHIDGCKVLNCFFTEGARAAMWYCHNLIMEDSVVESPKMFREMDGLSLQRVKIPNAIEFFWQCANVSLKEVEIQNADYAFLHSHDLKIEDYKHQGNYSFQYCRNIEIHNAEILSRDAFWETENVTVYNSVLKGAYLGWHSKRLKLVNCKISGTQPLCYADDLVLENCEMDVDCDLSFEYSTVRASINGHITSVKNPTSGIIEANSISEIILDENIKQPANCHIIERGRK